MPHSGDMLLVRLSSESLRAGVGICQNDSSETESDRGASSLQVEKGED